MWNIEPTLTEGAKYCFPREWQREMWQHIYYTSSNIFTTRPFESNIFASPALDVYPFLSLEISASYKSVLIWPEMGMASPLSMWPPAIRTRSSVLRESMISYRSSRSSLEPVKCRYIIIYVGSVRYSNMQYANSVEFFPDCLPAPPKLISID